MPRMIFKVILVVLVIGAVGIAGRAGYALSQTFVASSSKSPSDLHTVPVIPFDPVPTQPAEDDEATTCIAGLGDKAANVAVQAAKVYASFPSETVSNKTLLSQIKPLLLPDVFTQLEASWNISGSPAGKSTKVSVLTCSLAKRVNSSQQIYVQLKVDSRVAGGSPRTDYLTLDITLVRPAQSEYKVALIGPFVAPSR